VRSVCFWYSLRQSQNWKGGGGEGAVQNVKVFENVCVVGAAVAKQIAFWKC